MNHQVGMPNQNCTLHSPFSGSPKTRSTVRTDVRTQMRDQGPADPHKSSFSSLSHCSSHEPNTTLSQTALPLYFPQAACESLPHLSGICSNVTSPKKHSLRTEPKIAVPALNHKPHPRCHLGPGILFFVNL